MQVVTPEIKTWIIQQARAGYPVNAVMQAMRAAGWSEPVAVAAIDEAVKEYISTMPPAPPASIMRPYIDLSRSPCTIDVSDRMVNVLLTMAKPRIALLSNVLSDEECETLVREAEPRLKRSNTVDNETGGEQLHPDRTSDGMFFSRGETPLIQRIEERLSRLINWPVENGEGLQVLRYKPGAEYKPHYDYFIPDAPGTSRIIANGGQRVATVVIYLNDVERGGGTTFPDVGLEVMPKRGHAVFFAYDQPDPSTLTLHAGAPVIEGEKWIAVKWLREFQFLP